MDTATILLEFRHEFFAPPALVFAALTRADQLACWMCDAAESESMVGGRLTLRWNGAGASAEPFRGHWVVYRPPFSCAFDGGHAGYPDGNAGRVGFEIAPGGTGTVLITRHRLPQRPDYEPIAETYRGAWPRALARLTALLDQQALERPA